MFRLVFSTPGAFICRKSRWRRVTANGIRPTGFEESGATVTASEGTFMRRSGYLAPLADQRGIALAMALLALLILSTLVIAFGMLATSEPLIANNHKLAAQARALAESGLERAIWALNNPTDLNGIPNPMTMAPAPYDGSTTIPVSVTGAQIGVFTVSITGGANPNERNVVATGWAPTNTGSARKAHQTIQATVHQIRFLNPPATLTVRGEIGASGDSTIDSRADTSCGNKAGTWSLEFTQTTGPAAIYGADGNDTPNQATDVIPFVPDESFNLYTYSNAELDGLKSIAKARGTYHQGSVTFGSRNKLPNGLIYVDTVSGNDITTSTSISDFASVTIQEAAPADRTGIFSGWLIIAGSLSISGSFQMHGMAYVLNDLSYTDARGGQIEGAVITQNTRRTSTTIDTNTGGNATIVYNCSYARTGGGQIPQTWMIKLGTYKEVSG